MTSNKRNRILISTLLMSSIVIIPIVGPPFKLIATASQPSSDESSSDESENQEQRHCDVNVCDTIVAKCRLTNRCLCDFKKDALCAKICIDCLEELFGKCCACVNLCPSLKEDLHSSHVGNIKPNITDEELFYVLTETDDIHGRWNVVTKTQGLEVVHPEYGPIEMAYRYDGQNTLLSHEESFEKKKCQIAFINKHLYMDQCKKYCTSMGASYYRWFHEGCCECIGKYCLNYGLDEPKCLGID